jgi:hypothetical protein
VWGQAAGGIHRHGQRASPHNGGLPLRGLSLSLPSREASPTDDAHCYQNNARSDDDPPFLVHAFPPVYDLFLLSV